MTIHFMRRQVIAWCAIALAGCGSNTDSDSSQPQSAVTAGHIVVQDSTAAATRSGGAVEPTEVDPQQAMLAESSSAVAASAAQMTPEAASRFLAQATMGANVSDINELVRLGTTNWLNMQFSTAQKLHRLHVSGAMQSLPGGRAGEDQFYESFWRQVCTGRDQLRQRVTFALSQIFVVSFQDDELAVRGRSVATFYDTLGKHAFGNFRNLLEDIAKQPAMGLYLTYLRNKKETDTTVPDENFARELMQLMTIGLYQLNQDGTQKLVDGKPVETYKRDDVAGLAKVFTGWSWGGPDKSDLRFHGGVADPNRDWLPMQNYPQYHSTSAKQVLGRPLPAGTGEEELDAALDRLFNHPNVGPFIGKQLIQRLVTSNPSPAYVSRVAAAFNNNGSGVRGDMRAVIKAILLDSEARTINRSRSAGRVREPLLRLAHWMRAFYARSDSGQYRMWQVDDPLNGFAQTVMRAPSVFNFYRPFYTPPGSSLAEAGMVAPELQIASEPAVVGYLNTMKGVVETGIGKDDDIKPNYAREMELVADPDKLIDRLDLVLMGGQMSTLLRGQIRNSIESIVVLPNASPATARYLNNHRIYVAVFLAMASPEYIVQK